MSQTTGSCCSTISWLADRGASVLRFQTVVDEGLESSSAIFWQPHWCSCQLGADDDEPSVRNSPRACEQVLAEAALLPLSVSEATLRGRCWCRAERGAAPLSNSASTASEACRFSLRTMTSGRVQLHQLFQAVVAIDDAAIQIVSKSEVAKRRAIQPHERTQLRRRTGRTSKIIHSGLLPPLARRFEHFQALRRT